jgi:hypothetical protein
MHITQSIVPGSTDKTFSHKTRFRRSVAGRDHYNE